VMSSENVRRAKSGRQFIPDAVSPGPEATDAARSIANYCSARFQVDSEPLLDLPWFAEAVQKAIDRAGRQETKQLEAALKLNADVRTAADEMLDEMIAEYGNGVRNGYFPGVGVLIDRWCDLLGRPRLERYGRDGVAD